HFLRMIYAPFTYLLRINFGRHYDIIRQYCRLMLFDDGLKTIRIPFSDENPCWQHEFLLMPAPDGSAVIQGGDRSPQSEGASREKQ
ncbi:MAG: hypothetical protein WCX65_18880, partial [bacterium]